MRSPRLLPGVAVGCAAFGLSAGVEAHAIERADGPSVIASASSAAQVEENCSTERSVEFTNPDTGSRLAGTLTVPSGTGPFPGVVLISGSGSQDRDETIGGTVKPFQVLASGLALRGIVVLRFDDRGTGESAGEPVEVSGATTVDLATDALAAADFLSAQPEVAADRVGVIGHSEGALIAPIVANDAPELVSFLVLLAGPALAGAEVLERQTADILTAEGAPAEIVDWSVEWTRRLIEIAASDLPTPEAAEAMREVVDAAIASAPPGAAPDDASGAVEATIAAFTDPWMRFFLAYDPAPALADLQLPVLVLFGGLDVQVAADVNASAAEAALANNADASVAILDGLNHLFQPATTGALSEYGTLGQPFPTETITLIADWIDTYAGPSEGAD